MTHGDLQGYDDSSRPMSDLTTSDRTSLSDQEGEPYHRPQAPSPEAFDGEVDMANRPRFAGSTQADERPVSIGESIYDAYGGSDGGDIYYDARESGQYDKEYSRVTSGGTFSTPKGEEEDDEPFFTGSNAVPVEYSAPKKTAPTVILRPHSPEEAPEQLPLTSKSPPRDKKPTPAGPGPAPVPYHGAAASTPSFVKEYGYQQHYGQTSQQHQAQPAGMHHPAPQRHLDVPPAPHSSISPPSSPELVRSPSLSPSAEGPYVRPFSAPPTTSDRPSSAEKKEKAEKDKKSRGLFGWGGSKDKEKEKEKEREKEREKEKEKEKEKKERDLLKKQKKEKSESKSSGKEEKESGGGLFGIFGSKKKHDSDSSSSHGSTNPSSQTNRYPGAKGQLMPFATVSPALAGQYARYPLHVERAVYRLSHIKLANPRRPLYEQVLISNLMFWYLGIINKPATPPTEAKPAVQAGDGPTTNQSPSVSSSPPAQSAADSNGQPVMSTAMSPAQQAAAAQAAAAAAAAEKTKLEREKKEQQEREEREREMQEMQERERRERDQRERMEREKAEKEREKSAKKTGLTKADRDGRSRRAEMPVKTPNYDAQSRIMEQQYWEQDRERSGSGRPNTAPGSSSPPTPAQSHTAYHLPVRVQQRGAPGPQQPYFYQQDLSQVVYQPINPYALPPGAKPPAPVENTWAVTSSAAAHANEIKRGQSPPSQYYSSGAAPAAGANDRPRPSRSPPPQEYSVQPSGMPNGARPARSLSATAVNKPSGPTASGSFPPTNPPSSSADYGRERPVAHQYSQSASPVINGGSSNPQPAVGSSSSGRLQKKKSTNNTNNTNNGPNDGTKPPARRRKSLEVGAGDRRGIVEPDISFESMWQQVQGQIQ
ncbi:hypothetical protein FRC18_009523 [Serendipita sp. 400]|nr:hypothetical protein FRC18_009523 [Serendipita sp. 400]